MTWIHKATQFSPGLTQFTDNRKDTPTPPCYCSVYNNSHSAPTPGSAPSWSHLTMLFKANFQSGLQHTSKIEERLWVLRLFSLSQCKALQSWHQDVRSMGCSSRRHRIKQAVGSSASWPSLRLRAWQSRHRVVFVCLILWFTMLCSFLLHSQVPQRDLHTHFMCFSITV